MKKGFTLIELAIVSVIVGLLIAGIVIGQSLVESAKIQSIIIEFEQFRKATNTFKDKYRAWPGDMPNASSFWSAGGLSIDGNGDGDWGQMAGACNAVTSDMNSSSVLERSLIPVHLAKAGLIEQELGVFTAIDWTTKSAAESSDVLLQGEAGSYYAEIYAHGWCAAGSLEYPLNAFLTIPTSSSSGFTHQRGFSIDQKIDDGIPDSGIFELEGVASYDLDSTALARWKYYFVGKRVW